jgi:hypothetical protein
VLDFGFPETSQSLSSFKQFLFSSFHRGDQRKKIKKCESPQNLALHFLIGIPFYKIFYNFFRNVFEIFFKKIKEIFFNIFYLFFIFFRTPLCSGVHFRIGPSGVPVAGNTNASLNTKATFANGVHANGNVPIATRGSIISTATKKNLAPKICPPHSSAMF